MASLRKVLQPPIAIRQAVQLLRCPPSVGGVLRAVQQPFQFDEPLVTGSGVALGGHHSLVLRPDRTYSYRGYMRATGWPSYDFSVATTVRLPALPGFPEQIVVFAAAGGVHGTNEAGEEESAWQQDGRLPILPLGWWRLPAASYDVRLEYDTDWFGSIGGVVSFLAQLVALSWTGGVLGAGLVVAGTLADIFDVDEVIIPGMIGVIALGGAVFVVGPNVLVPVFIASAAATAALVQQRRMQEDEWQAAKAVFGESLPRDRIVLTNLSLPTGSKFVLPAPGGAILVNLGEFFDDPLRRGDERYPVGGQLLMHELTHAWQIANETFTPGFYCEAIFNRTYTFGNYDGRPWSNYGPEQQATIVDRWYAGRAPDGTWITGQIEDEAQNQFFRYIRDNIRAGIA